MWSDRAGGALLGLATAAIWLYYTVWVFVAGAPGAAATAPALQAWFPAPALAVLLPGAAGVALLLAVTLALAYHTAPR